MSEVRNDKRSKERHHSVEKRTPPNRRRSISPGPPGVEDKLSSNKTKPLKCTYCEKSFHSITALDEHTSMHFPEDDPDSKLFNCSFCEKLFTKVQNLHNHMLEVHDGQDDKARYYDNNIGLIKCKLCSKVFDKLSNLEDHVILEHKDELSRRDVLSAYDQLYSNEEKYIQYYDNLYDSKNFRALPTSSGASGRMYKCEFCYKTFNKVSNLEVHFLSHFEQRISSHSEGVLRTATKYPTYYNDTPYTATASSEGNLGSRVNKCPKCGKVFNKIQNLYVHMDTHTEEEILSPQSARPIGTKDNECPHCGKVFNKIANLRTHINSAHNGDSLPNRCKYCNKSFNKLQNLHVHMMTHKDDRPFKCWHCEISFNKVGNLKTHVQQVHKDRSSKRAGAFDGRKGNNSRPVRGGVQSRGTRGGGARSVRGGIPPIVRRGSPPQNKCHYCDKLFNKVNNLKTHIMTAHPNEESSRNRSKNYDNHSRSPSYERRSSPAINTRRIAEHRLVVHRCKYCNFAFNTVYDLDFHIKVKHEENDMTQHKCEICHKVFNKANNLKIHLKSHEEYTSNKNGFRNQSRSSRSISRNRSEEIHSRVRDHRYRSPSVDDTRRQEKRGRSISKTRLRGTRSKTRSRSRHRDSDFKCKYCYKVFNKLNNLKTHTESCRNNY